LELGTYFRRRIPGLLLTLPLSILAMGVHAIVPYRLQAAVATGRGRDWFLLWTPLGARNPVSVAFPCRPSQRGTGSRLVILLATLCFIHSDLRWRLGPLEWLIATPGFHHWHHTLSEPLDRNYASILRREIRRGRDGRLCGAAFFDADDARGEHRTLFVVELEFETHAATDEVLFQHGATPSRAFDARQHGFGAVDRMSGDYGKSSAFIHDGVRGIARTNFEDRLRWDLRQIDAAFNFRLRQIAIDRLAPVFARTEIELHAVLYARACPMWARLERAGVAA
jgi:hypothetical protein